MSGLLSIHSDSLLPPVPLKDCFGIFIHADYKNKCVSQRYCGQEGANKVFLNHKTPYGVGIFNGSDGQANASIYIGSEFIGKFRVESKDCILIKRSLKTPRNFTFVSQFSAIACQNDNLAHNDSAIVRVVMYPQDMSSPAPSYFVNHYDMSRNLHRSALENNWKSDSHDGSQNEIKNTKWSWKSDSHDGPQNELKSAKGDCIIGTGRGLKVENDCASTDVNNGYLESTLSNNFEKIKGVTVLGAHVNQNFIPERYPLRTRGHHTFILHLTIGDPSENNVFMMDTDAQFYSPI